MSSAEAEALLIATTNSFGRQHHLNRKRSDPIPFYPLDTNVAGKHSFSASALDGGLPQLATDREAVITRSGGSSGFWFDAEACNRCDQHASSPPCSSRSGRSGEAWHDAVSEAGSVASSLGNSSALDGSCPLPCEGHQQRRSSGNGSCSLDAAATGSEWKMRLEGEVNRRQVADRTAAELREQRQRLRAQLEAMEAAHADELAAARRETAVACQDAQEAQAAADAASAAAAQAVVGARAASEAKIAAARLVSGVFARVTSCAEAEQQLALLRGRVERLGLMSSAMSQQPRPGSDREESLQRQLVNAGVAVCCTAVGVVGAYLIIRKVR